MYKTLKIIGITSIVLLNFGLVWAIDQTEILYGSQKLKIIGGRALVTNEGGTFTITGVVTQMPHDWIIRATTTVIIAPTESKTITIWQQPTDYWLYSITISGMGGDVRIKVVLPTPHANQIFRINSTSPNAVFCFGEGIKISAGTAISVIITSTDSEIGQEIDLSWQISQ